MIRKNAVSLILAATLALTLLVSLPIAHAAAAGSTNADPSVVLSDDIPTPTPTPGGSSTDSGVSGGGNGG